MRRSVVEPWVSVITDISLDHQKYLGNTVGEIAREKVGIIRSGGAVVTLPQQPEANDVIGNTILELGARAVNAVPYVPPVSPGSGEYLVPSTEEEYRAGDEEPLTAKNAEEAAKIAKKYVYRYPLQVLGDRFWWRHLWWGGISCAMWHWPLRRQRSCISRIQRHHGEDRRERYPGDAVAGTVPGDCGAAGVAGDGHRCGAQSRGRVGAAFGPFGAL